MEHQKLDFKFVKDDQVRLLLEEYYDQALKASKAEAHLGAVVACGSVVEGLLTWALLQRQDKALQSSKACKDREGTVKPLEEWYLNNLIDVSVELELIGKTAKAGSWALKDFRNFIHPYNVLNLFTRNLTHNDFIRTVHQSLRDHFDKLFHNSSCKMNLDIGVSNRTPEIPDGAFGRP